MTETSPTPSREADGPERTQSVPVILVVIASALFVSAFFIFPAIYIPAQHNGGLVEAFDVVLGGIAPAVFVVSLVARYKARRIIRDDRAKGIASRRSVQVSRDVAFSLALLSGIPAAVGLLVVLFLLIALSAAGE